MAAVTWPSSYGPAKVSTGCRSSGGVAIVLISRMPVIAISSVRGIGRGRHGQHVDGGPQPLQLLLVLDAEPLLLVDDHQAEVLELDLRRQQPVGADHDVDLAVGQALDRRPGLGVGLEPAERGDVDREPGVPVGEGGVVLLDQQRGRHQDRHLLAVLHRLERRPHRDLGLAVADVAADQPVHRDDLLHVPLDLVDRGQLVGGLDEAEGVLELALPGGVGARTRGRGWPAGRRTA